MAIRIQTLIPWDILKINPKAGSEFGLVVRRESCRWRATDPVGMVARHDVAHGKKPAEYSAFRPGE